MQIDETLVRNVVEQVVARLKSNGQATVPMPGARPGPVGGGYQGRFGQFTCVDEAVAAASEAFERLSQRTLADRKRMLDHIRRICREQYVELGTMEMEETKIGRLEHKLEKQRGVAETLGVEFLRSEVYSGDHGLAVIERAPFGVIGVITPVTHSLPTLTCNAIQMIAAGNTLVVNPHPGGRRVAAEGARRYNEAIYRDCGIDNLISVVTEPTLDTANQVFTHPGIALLSVTGGPGVAKAAMKQAKRALVAGPGNPPVVVDETADLDRAARCIIYGAAYDNNLLCISEKQVFVVDRVFDAMMAAMGRAGALRLSPAEVDALTRVAIAPPSEETHGHPVANKEFVGRDAADLARAVGRNVPAGTELVFGETDESNLFVAAEQMMPFLPFVRARDVDHAIDMAVRSEHGFRHTAVIHSHDVTHMTRMGKRMDTTIFVKNGASLAGLGNGGEGYGSYSIAGLTGEGITTPYTYTRERRCTMVDSLRILGK
ncbi:MAG: aldehyde dehydrogenase EutE [Thermoguttaceae bacterium]|jgi:aldehyde dehydrogenase|nr:aldehyde dehydrogenase EutE [Thermoguttaceae bacterium]